MYIYDFISIFNQIWTSVFKRTLILVNFFFSLIKTHIFHLIQVFIIVTVLPKFWFFMIHSTYFFVFVQYDLIHHIVNNIFVLFLFLEYFPRYGVAPAFLSRLGCSILSPKFPQDLAFIGIMSNVVDNTVFWFTQLSTYFYGACYRSHPSRGEYLTRRILLSFPYLFQYSWILPDYFF